MVTRFITTFLVVCLFQGCGLQMQTSNATVNIGGEAFQLEIVRDMQSRAQGLMHRDEIPADGGMLFIFSRYGAPIFLDEELFDTY